LAKQEENLRDQIAGPMKKLLDQLEKANSGRFPNGLPDGEESFDQLPASVRESLLNSFLRNFKRYGFESEDAARAAWASARLVGSGVTFSMEYGVENPDGSKNLRSIEITRSGS
jgi:hypothetical protein